MVTSGKDKGKEGTVEKVLLEHQTVLVPGLNTYKKHRKPQGQNVPGDILTLSRPLNVAKVALLCPRCKQATRVGYQIINGKKVRVCRKCDQEIDSVAKTAKTEKTKAQIKTKTKK